MRRAALALLALCGGCGPAPVTAFEPCDIETAACQTHVFLALEQLRGQLWDPWSTPPRARVITVEEHRRLVLARVGGAGSSPALQQLGLLPAGVDAASADRDWFSDNVAATYWPATKEVTIVDRGKGLEPLAATGILAHEYVHVAQDREFDLGAHGSSTTDWALVRTALIEGEAELYGQLAELQMRAMAPRSFAWQEYYRGWFAEERAFTARAPSPHAHVRLALPYPTGGAFMSAAWLRGGPPAVNDVFLHPPQAFLQLMLAMDGLPPAPLPAATPCTLPRQIGASLRLVERDTLGAALFYAFLLHLSGREADAWQAALTWRGDQLSLFGSAFGRPGLTAWVVHAPGLRASPLGPALEARTEAPVLVGDQLLFWAGGDADAEAAVRAAVQCP